MKKSFEIDLESGPITESDPIKPENAIFLCLLILVVYFTRKVEMNEYNGSELFGMHYNIFPGCCCCIRPTYFVAVRLVTMAFTCVG